MNTRNMQLSKIHIAKKDLGIDDDTYRVLLMRVTGAHSAKGLKPAQMAAVLSEFERMGWKPKKNPGRVAPKASPEREKLVKKIGAFLTTAGRSWAYADGMAKRMYKVERTEWLNPKQLQGVVAALEYDAKRRGVQTS